MKAIALATAPEMITAVSAGLTRVVHIELPHELAVAMIDLLVSEMRYRPRRGATSVFA